MYPNPQDVLPLPPHPSAEQYRKRAKALVRAHEAGIEAIGAWSRDWVATVWRTQDGNPVPAAPSRNVLAGDVDRSAQQVATFATERLSTSTAPLSQAQFVLARAHGFPSWARLMQHIGSSRHDDAPHQHFEQAADAIMHGDLDRLGALLREEPTLITARSDRSHGATLLHYVSANGVENYRQRTPANIVAIAQLLLDAGADVHATCDVYGGGADTLGLVVTSAHPRAAGVQLALADLLVARGAHFDAGTVRGSLANGCPEAAAHIASLCLTRGIALGLPELAGAGCATQIAQALREKPWTIPDQGEAMSMAAWYGRDTAVAALLDGGVSTQVRNGEGATALHVAAYAGQLAVVHLLLQRGADVHDQDMQYHSTPLGWARHAWQVDGRTPVDVYESIVAHLHQAMQHTAP